MPYNFFITSRRSYLPSQIKQIETENVLNNYDKHRVFVQFSNYSVYKQFNFHGIHCIEMVKVYLILSPPGSCRRQLTIPTIPLYMEAMDVIQRLCPSDLF